MTDTTLERWGAASGLTAFVLGAAGGALERGWPPASDPAAVASYVVEYRSLILAQSALMLLSAALFVWFIATLHGYLRRAEGTPGTFSLIVFSGGLLWVGINMVAQAFQVGIGMTPSGEASPALLWSFGAVFATANLPMAVMLSAKAVVVFRHKAFPSWLGVLSLVAAASELLLWIGTFIRSGPLSPTGWAAFILYPAFAVWLLPTAIVMLRRIGKPTARRIPIRYEDELVVHH